MGSIVVSTTMSLDGFVAGPNHEMDWIFDGGFLPDEPVAAVDDLIARTGAILAGRRSYDVGRAATRTETSSAFGGRWSGPEYVLTHHPPQDADGDVRFLTGDVRDAVATAAAAAGEHDVLVLGANVAQQCLDADLVDELFLIVVPTVLGAGISLFGSDGRRARFATAYVDQAGEAVLLRFARS